MEPPPSPSPTPAPAPAPGAWVVEATLLMVLGAHLLSIVALRFTAKAMPVFALQACVFGPLGVLVALLGAREFTRRTSRRAGLGALVLLAGATTILPAFAPRHLAAGALRDLERAGGADKLVAEGRALLQQGGQPRPIDLTTWPTARIVGISAEVRATPAGPAVFVEAFRLGEPSGFLIVPPGAPRQGRPLADGLSWVP